jgi:hypothetical protein
MTRKRKCYKVHKQNKIIDFCRTVDVVCSTLKYIYNFGKIFQTTNLNQGWAKKSTASEPDPTC